MTAVLVTGSEGSIGRYLVSDLQRTRPEWRIIRVRQTPDPNPAVDVGDLRDRAFLDRLFDIHHITYVIHGAARPYQRRYLAHPFDLFQHDLVVLLNVLESASASVQRVVLLSSGSVYESVSAERLAEDSVTATNPPRSPLALAKWVGEQAVRMWSSERSRSHTIWRLFNVVSPLEPHRSDGHVFVDLYRKMFVERSAEIQLRGSGTQRRAFVWIEEACRKMIASLDDPRAHLETFNLGGKEPGSITDLAETLLSIGHDTGLLPVDYRPEIRGDTDSVTSAATLTRVPDLSKVARELRWEPQLGFRECFERFVTEKAVM